MHILLSLHTYIYVVGLFCFLAGLVFLGVRKSGSVNPYFQKDSVYTFYRSAIACYTFLNVFGEFNLTVKK